MKVKLLVNNKELTNISNEAKVWFYESILNGNDGPFKVLTIDRTTNAVLLVESESDQLELF